MRLQYLKTLILSLSFILLLLESCSVYQKTPVTLEEAAKSGVKAKVEQKGQRDLYAKKIENKDGVYYAVQNNGAAPTRLEENDVTAVRVLDKPKSDLGNVLLIVGIAAAVGGFILAATFTPF